MNYDIENPFFQLSIYPEIGTWNIQPLTAAKFQAIQIEICCQDDQGRAIHLNPLKNGQLLASGSASSIHGPIQQLIVQSSTEQPLRIQVKFALPEKFPLALWQMEIQNTGSRPVYPGRLTMLCLSTNSFHRPERKPSFFSNGWQSWSYTGAYQAADRYKRTHLGPLTTPIWFNHGTPRPTRRGNFTSDFFGVLGNCQNRQACLVGFLSQQQHFGSLEVHQHKNSSNLLLWANGDRARLDPGASLCTDWACLSFLDVDTAYPLSEFTSAAARQNGIDPSTGIGNTAVSGWCSWYHFYQKITPQIIRDNLNMVQAMASEAPLKMIQIDDGYEAQVGDWLRFNPAFPAGVAPLATEIRQAGLTPGLWLAPFIVHPKARLAAEHPDWLLRSASGKAVNAGFIWNTLTAALDLTNPEALDYTCQVVDKAAHEWGFPFLKLDFLYAAALPGKYKDPTQTRAQVMRKGLKVLRQAAGVDTVLLGCGCPLGSAIGLVDAMRIGSDVSQRWEPAYFGVAFPFKEEWGMPSARNAIQNALTRSGLHRHWWINDPDCLLLRPTMQLSTAEVQSLATVIALTGGSLLLSDHLPDLPEDRKRILQALLPIIDRAPQVIDWLDNATPQRLRMDLSNSTGDWHILAQFNWTDQTRERPFRAKEFHLEEHSYYAREFWSGRYFPDLEGTTLDLSPHGVALLAVRKHSPHAPQYLGSDLHISQGLEVSGWSIKNHTLCVALRRPAHAQGRIALCLPARPVQASLAAQPTSWEEGPHGSYVFPLAFDQQANLQIAW